MPIVKDKDRSVQPERQPVEYRFVVDADIDSDVRDALRIEAKKRGVPRVTLKEFANRALGRAARETLALVELERAGR